MVDAIVLAGGKGTRLRSIVSNVPKPMAPVDGRPFLRYILDNLTAKGIFRIILAVGYMREVIEKYFGDSYRGAQLIYSPEDAPLLTGGAVKNAVQFCNTEEVFIVNGDSYFDVDLREMMNLKKKLKAPFILAAKKMYNFDRYGKLLLSDDCRIIKFNEKGFARQGVINGGIYLMDRHLLDSIPMQSFSLEKDFLEQNVQHNKFFVFISEGYFIDIGCPEDYKKAQYEFKERHPL